MISDDELDLTIPSEDKAALPDDLRLWSRWERLRIVYNLILIAEVFVCVAIFGFRPSVRHPIGFLMDGAIFANLCFCAGPVIEGYTRRVGIRGASLTWILFFVGLFLAVLLTGYSFVVNLN